MGLEKVQKQGRDENTRRLSCCRKVVVKKDWKNTLHLLHIQATEVDQSSRLSLRRLSCSRIVFLCFHPFFVSVHFTGPSLLTLNFTKKFQPLVYVLFWLLDSKVVKTYGSTSYSNFNNSLDD